MLRRRAPSGRDVRASRLYLLSRGPILSVVRRVLSVAALVVLDVIGLALGIYLALVLRQVVTGDGDVLWSLLWREGPAEWLKFAAPITVLVFAQSGLYRQRELRPGAGWRRSPASSSSPSSCWPSGWGRASSFSTSGLIPTSVVAGAVTIGLLRAGYELPAHPLEVMSYSRSESGRPRRRGGRVHPAEELARCGAQRAHLPVGLGVVAPEAVPGFRLLGSRAELPHVLDQVRPDEVILTEADFDERTVLEVVEQAHGQGIKVRLAPDTTELLVQRGESFRTGAPLFELRPPGS